MPTKNTWQPRTGHMLNLNRQPENCRDKCTVAIIKADGTTVRHIPYNLARLSHRSLRETATKVPSKSRGKESQLQRWYGLEVNYFYHLFGLQKFTQ